MRRAIHRSWLIGAAAAALLAGCTGMSSPQSKLSFFVTSANPGQGGNLGGLDGADKHCQKLAAAAGAGHRTWRAYLSKQPLAGEAGINARDRIGKGPWQNAKGEVIATSVADLHGPGSKLNKQTAITETGAIVNGRGDTPNQHDMLTGSQPDGGFIAGDVNSTCSNWTLGDDTGKAMVGHHDRVGLDDSVPAKSWNSSHLSRGCSPAALKQTGGAGQYYCFAAD
jgi:hypothetical protein